MSRSPAVLAVFAVLFIFTGCYNASVVTNQQPSNQTIENKWAHSFIGGLVPPATVETAQQCPNGVARVETKLSFLNMVAHAATFSLYSPMTIEVTCAQGGPSAQTMPVAPESDDILIPAEALPSEVTDAFELAVMKSAQTGSAVTVRFAD